MNRIRKMREAMNLHQKDIAKILNISQQQYSRYENGKNQLPYDVLMKLADFYNTSVDYILYLTDDK